MTRGNNKIVLFGVTALAGFLLYQWWKSRERPLPKGKVSIEMVDNDAPPPLPYKFVLTPEEQAIMDWKLKI